MHISSLPGPYGIGTMGDNAYRFVDFLQRAGQTWWQILPIGPTSYGDSPYQSFSSVAGNPYFIDLPQLERDGLLERDEYERLPWCESELSVDYGQLYQLRYEVLHHAYRRFAQQHRELYWLVMDTAAGEPRVLDDAAARFTEPLKQVLSGVKTRRGRRSTSDGCSGPLSTALPRRRMRAFSLTIRPLPS
mgnify:CR=1 FL=1